MPAKKTAANSEEPAAPLPETPPSTAMPDIPDEIVAEVYKASAPAPNEVRQCQDQGTPQYGAVAVRSSLPAFAWGVFHPTNGGHWETNDDLVGDWKVIS
jgi:hypothetical protein